ncbi:MAG: hypothetical protein IT370_32105 [Deltaproteobacteria bacterium]|nr:hypothetical protein [Deltaproteobacteria bacterium]
MSGRRGTGAGTGPGGEERTPVPDDGTPPPAGRGPLAGEGASDSEGEGEDWGKALETWELSFSQKVAPEVLKPLTTAPAAPAAPDPMMELFGEGDIELGSEGQALGTLLGDEPPPLPPEPAEADAAGGEVPVATPSVRRNIQKLEPRPAAGATSAVSELPPAPTDDEIFGGIEDQEWSDSLGQSTANRSPDPALIESLKDKAGEAGKAPAPGEVTVEAEPGDAPESTRLAGPEMAELVRQSSGVVGPGRPAPAAASQPSDDDGGGDALLEFGAGAPEATRLAGPEMAALVDQQREVQRQTPEQVHSDFGDDHGPETTRLAGPEMAELVSQSGIVNLPPSSPRLPAPQSAPREVVLDDDAYDEIEIASGGEEATAGTPSGIGVAEQAVNLNVSRREDAPSPSPSVLRADSVSPTGAPVLVELELDEPEPSHYRGEPTARLGSEALEAGGDGQELGRVATPLVDSPSGAVLTSSPRPVDMAPMSRAAEQADAALEALAAEEDAARAVAELTAVDAGTLGEQQVAARPGVEVHGDIGEHDAPTALADLSALAASAEAGGEPVTSLKVRGLQPATQVQDDLPDEPPTSVLPRLGEQVLELGMDEQKTGIHPVPLPPPTRAPSEMDKTAVRRAPTPPPGSGDQDKTAIRRMPTPPPSVVVGDQDATAVRPMPVPPSGDQDKTAIRRAPTPGPSQRGETLPMPGAMAPVMISAEDDDGGAGAGETMGADELARVRAEARGRVEATSGAAVGSQAPTALYRVEAATLPPVPVPRAPAADGPDLTTFTAPTLELSMLRLPSELPASPPPDQATLSARLELWTQELGGLEVAAARAAVATTIGQLGERLGEPDRARAGYEAALDAHPGHLPALRGLRRLALAAGQFDVALPLLEEERQGGSPAERLVLDAYRTDLLLGRGEQDLARLVVGELLDASPDHRRGLMAALELAYSDGRDEEIGPLATRLAGLTQDPALAGALLVLRARLAERAGDDAGAQAGFGSALTAAPGDTAALVGAARVAERAGRGADAATSWATQGGAARVPALRRLALARATEAEATRTSSGDAMARAADATGALEAARQIAEAAAGEGGGDALSLEALAQVGSSAATLAALAASTAAAATGSGPDATAAFAEASAHAAQAQAAAAQAAAQAAADHQRWAAVEPDAELAVQVLERAAELAEAAGDRAAAEAALRAAVRADKQAASAWLRLSRVVAASGDPIAEASFALERAAAQPARAAYYRLGAARRQLAAAGWDENQQRFPAAPGPGLEQALQSYDQAAAAEGAPRLLHRELARIELAAGRHGGAMRALLRAAEREPDPDLVPALREQAALAAEQAARGVGGASAATADYAASAALILAAQIWEQVGDTPSAAGAALRLAAAAGNHAELASRLSAAAEGAPPARAASLHVRRAQLLEAADPELAAGAALAALAEDAREPRAFALAARLALAGRRIDDLARLCEQRAGELPPGPERWALRLRAAELYAGELNDPDRAAALLADVAPELPGFQHLHDLLVELHRRTGDAPALARALEPRGSATEVTQVGDTGASRKVRFAKLIRLAEVLEAEVSDPGMALERYRAALEVSPGDPLAQGGYERAAARAGETAALSELALARLKDAEAVGDITGKVAAYAELARIDGDLRGDASSALLAYESIADLAPTHVAALRALERSYLGDPERVNELGVVYDKLATATTSPAGAEALALERARLRELHGTATDALEAYRAVRLRAPLALPALVQLDAAARASGDLGAQANLADALAEAHKQAPRSRAAFLTRGGEAHADQAPRPGHASPEQAGYPDGAGGHLDAASARLRLAAATDHLPALRALERIGLASERWEDVVFASERLGHLELDPVVRVRSLLTAAACAEDRLGDDDAAVRVLVPLLTLEPGHTEAFVRLRGIYSRTERWGELAQLLEARVARETEPAHQLDLHQSLAALYQGPLSDPGRARAELGRILALTPSDPGALSALAELAWAAGSWGEAAELLIRRARQERDPAELKAIFQRLGVLYDEHLPDPARASQALMRALQIPGDDASDAALLERLAQLSMRQGDWQSALGATDRLLRYPADAARALELTHRVARIYEEGLGDPRHAEETYRRAVEQHPTDLVAILALTEFYQRRRDTMALRVHLDRTAGAMRTRLLRDAFDIEAYRVLHRVLGWRGARDASGAAAAALVLIGVADGDEQAAAEAARLHSPPSIAPLADAAADDALFHRSLPSGFRQIFSLLGSILHKRYGSDLRRYGVGKNERLPRTGSGAREVAGQLGVQLGVGDVEVYVSAMHPTVLAVEPGSPPQVVVGQSLLEGAEAPELRFLMARALKLYRSGCALPARMSDLELGVLMGAIVRQFQPDFAPAGVDPAALADEAQRLNRLIPKNTRNDLAPFAIECVQVAMNPAGIAAGLAHTGNRVGLLAAGDVTAGVHILSRRAGLDPRAAGPGGLTRHLRGQPEVEELLRFAVSDDYLELRRQLGA